ncbi:MAG: hypothetical protein PHR16_10210 [Methylovulum sp.]|nr:hypothetical protein [Methylovulum sp.]
MIEIPEIDASATREEIIAWYENLQRQVEDAYRIAVAREAAKKKKAAALRKLTKPDNFSE